MNPFTDLVDVASEACGASVLEASDDFFAPKENLIRVAPPVFIPGKYTDRGKWMDGWESRRKRSPGHDWCIVRLGFRASLHAVNVDTSNFMGNFPSHCSLDARIGDDAWQTVLAKARLQGGGQNLFDLPGEGPFDQVRLNIFPDGGIARLRVYGAGMPDWSTVSGLADLAAAANGGFAISASDMFFGSRNNLILPGRPADMAGGWETRRRRGPGYDWVIVRLGAPGIIRTVRVETEHYKGNYPEACSIDACQTGDVIVEHLITGHVSWQEIIPKAFLEPDSMREFTVNDPAAFTHVRLNIYPDGGVSRLRVIGVPRGS